MTTEARSEGQAGIDETRVVLEQQVDFLRRHRDFWDGSLPKMAVVDLNHLITQFSIALDHLDPAIPVALLERGTVE